MCSQRVIKEVAIRSFTRVNHRIRVPNVRCVNADGTMVGVIPTSEARNLAMNQGLDLVEVSPPFDPSGATAFLGASIMFELLCAMVANDSGSDVV